MVTRVAVGLGCRTAASGEQIVEAIRQALALLPAPPDRVELFSSRRKAGQPGLLAAARLLGYPLALLDDAALAATADRLLTDSPRVRALLGVGSLAEAAALAGGGPDCVLVEPRRTLGGVACAVAAPRKEMAS
jgi:cobalt-precorrin 5A hydrolase